MHNYTFNTIRLSTVKGIQKWFWCNLIFSLPSSNQGTSKIGLKLETAVHVYAAGTVSDYVCILTLF